MAHVANANQSGSRFLNIVSGWFASWFSLLWNAAHNQAAFESRMRQMRKLESLSDEELAKMGISRDRIAYHVFRDIYYV